MKMILTLWILWKGLGTPQVSFAILWKVLNCKHYVKQENTLLVLLYDYGLIRFRIWIYIMS